MGGPPPVGVPGVDHPQISSAVHVCPRPHLKHFLDEVSKRWDVSIFTASTSETARPKIDWLVKYLGRAYFQRRFYRGACTTLSHHGLPLLFVKDLRTPLRSDADLARTVLVEDLPAVCGWQSSNVVPIDAWWGDPSDDALPRLLPLLAHLAPCDDVRRPLRRLFGFERGAKAHEGAGCPAYGTPTASPRAEWSAGPPGCTCASLYEHRLSAGFPLEWSACPPSQVATRHKPPPTTTPQKKRSDPAESPARALQTLEDSNGTPGKRARR